MGREKIVNDLYKFLKEDVTVEKLFEADISAYGDVLNEGKLPADTSVATSDQIQMLAEKKCPKCKTDMKGVKSHEKGEGKIYTCPKCGMEYSEKKESVSEKATDDPAVNKDIKTANAGITEQPEMSKVSKEMDKATSDTEKKSDFKQAAGVADVKDEKKATVKVTGVVSGNTDEGKLPADTSVATPDQIQKLAETEDIFTVSNEEAAKKIQSRFPNSKYERNTQGTFTVYVSEKTTEPSPAEVKAVEVPEVKAEKDANVPLKTMATDNSNALANSSQVEDPGTMKTTKQEQPASQPAVASTQVIDPGTTSTVKQEQAATEKGAVSTTEPAATAPASTSSAAFTKAEEDTNKLTKESKICDKCKSEKCECVTSLEKKVKEDVNITVKTDDKEVNINAVPGQTTVTTADAVAPAPLALPSDILTMEEPEVEEPEYEDVFATEMAERFYAADYLSGFKKITEKQAKFVADIKAKKISKKNKEKVSKKLNDMKKEK